MWDLAMEIKEGNFTAMLIRPISYYQFTFFRNLAWRIIRTSLFLPVFIVLLVGYHGFLRDAHVFISWQFVLSVILGHLVSFSFVMMMTGLFGWGWLSGGRRWKVEARDNIV